MSGTVSHLVGGEAHVARRVQVQVLLLPPMAGAPATGLRRWGGGSVGQLESPSRSKRDVPSGLARSTRAATASFELERTANGEAIRPEPGGSRKGMTVRLSCAPPCMCGPVATALACKAVTLSGEHRRFESFHMHQF